MASFNSGPDIRTSSDSRAVVAPGYFNRQVTIQAPIIVLDSQNGQVDTWQTPGVTVWAHVEIIPRGQDDVKHQQSYPVQKGIVSVRWRSNHGFTYKSRVLLDNDVWYVDQVINAKQANVVLDLHCSNYQTIGPR